MRNQQDRSSTELQVTSDLRTYNVLNGYNGHNETHVGGGESAGMASRPAA